MGYHIKFDEEAKEILAGTMNKKCTKFINCSAVTDEALKAVRDHFIYLSNTRKEDVAFAWQYPNGKTLVMKFEVVDSDKIKEEKKDEQ